MPPITTARPGQAIFHLQLASLICMSTVWQEDFTLWKISQQALQYFSLEWKWQLGLMSQKKFVWPIWLRNGGQSQVDSKVWLRCQSRDRNFLMISFSVLDVNLKLLVTNWLPEFHLKIKKIEIFSAPSMNAWRSEHLLVPFRFYSTLVKYLGVDLWQ